MAIRGLLVRVQTYLRNKTAKQFNGLRLGVLILEANGFLHFVDLFDDAMMHGICRY